jgi:predicted site-specific integrase-resolvase
MERLTLTERQFASVCGLSYGYIKRLRRRGLIPYHLRFGRRVLYKPSHVERFLMEHEQGQAVS